MKKWSVEAPSNRTKYLLLADDTLGHITSKVEEQQATDSVLARGEAPAKTEWLPFSYVRNISSPVSSCKVTVNYKKESSLEYVFTDVAAKNDFLKAVTTEREDLIIAITETSWLQAIRVQLVALVVLMVFFGWAFWSAQALENGTHMGTDLAIILLVASLGTATLGWVIPLVALILGARIYFNLKQREDVQTVEFRA